MITNFFIPELNNHDVQELWFQQDGATCHTARALIDLLKDKFGDRLISRFGSVNWPPRSCDLTPLDYFLWGYVKSLVYADKPQTLDHLEDNIHRVIADIRHKCWKKLSEYWTSRLDYIRASRGSPIPEIIFKMREKCIDFLESIENDPHFLEHVINGDESWVCLNTTRKSSASAWNGTLQHLQGQRKQDEQIKDKKNAHLVFFYGQGIVHKEFVPQGQTVNQHFYREVLERLRKRVMHVRPNIKNSWVLHLDNAPCHTAISVNRFLASKNIPVAPQPPYLPDLSPCDFFLFPKLKNHLKGHHFGTLENIETAVTDQLKSIPVSEFHQCYEEWKKRLQRCVASEGSYFEGDNVELYVYWNKQVKKISLII
ncbi:putative mariner transposase [Trichonephila clavipes]|nr:putative mariner transposase [Trichonephila clavipes]